MKSGDSRLTYGRLALVGLAVTTVLGLVLGVIGPFGSYLNGSAPLRIVYWVVSLWSGWVLFGLIVPRLALWARGRGLSVWLWAPPTVVLLAAPMTLISRALAQRMWPGAFEVGLLEWYGQSLIVSVLATGVPLWILGRTAPPVADPPTPLSADPRDRLPPHLGREVICLQMEDHYVRVHTPLGSDLILMSLSQAMAGLSGVEGRQTHRSWWVARAAVEGVVEDGRNLSLRLKGGLTAPVSRTRVAPLRAEGWL